MKNESVQSCSSPLTMTDPVCGMQVDPAQSKYHLHVGKGVYRFCSKDCQKKFEADPSKYTAKSA